MIRQFLSHSLLLLYVLLLAYLSLKLPSSDGKPLMWDKLAHFLAYSGFGVLAIAASPSRGRLAEWLVVGFMLGVTLEVLQGMTGYRYASLYDQLANTLGLLAGASLALLPPVAQRCFNPPPRGSLKPSFK